MRFSDIARSCTQNLLRRKSRTILTVLGVIVGCCSIVLMISIGQGINEQNEQMLKNMGNLNDIIAGVAGVLPQKTMSYSVDATQGAGSRYVSQYVNVVGVDATQLEESGYKLASGRLPMRAGEVLAGKSFVYSFYDKYASDSSNHRIEAGDYYCDENDCVQSEGEDPFFDMLNSKITLITGANYQSPDDYRKVGGGSVASSDSGSCRDWHCQHHDHVGVGTYSRNRHYEGSRLLCARYSHDVPVRGWRDWPSWRCNRLPDFRNRFDRHQSSVFGWLQC